MIVPPLLTSRFFASRIGVKSIISVLTIFNPIYSLLSALCPMPYAFIGSCILHRVLILQSTFHIPKSVLSRSFPLLYLGKDQIDKIGQQEEDDSKGNRYVEIAPACLHDGCSSQNPRITLDISAYHDGSPNL